MATLQDVAERHRRDLLARDRAASRDLVAGYGRAYRRIQAAATAVARKLAAAQAAGEEPSPAWLYQQGRLRSVTVVAARELTEFGEYAADLITDEQRAAMFAAQANAEELVRLLEPQEFEGVGAVWGEVDPEVPRALAGNLADGSPLRTRLVQLAREGARAVADTMVAHVARGAAPIELARELRGALGVNLSKAQTIARTETLRAYREVTRRSYQTNAHIVQAWIWHAALTSRTCAACWAMHGSTHELSDTLDGHPNCRCAMVPLTKSYEELGVIGVEENRRPVPMGPAEFARASSQTQRAILGDRAYAAYQAGEVQLADFVGQKHSDEWGSMRYRRSLREAREAAARGSAGLDINQPGTPSPFQQNPE